MLRQKIAFIGAGQMARALARGIVAAQLVRPDQISASDPSAEAREQFSAAVPGARVSADSGQVASQADVVFLSVKPAHMPQVLADLRTKVSANHLVISIAAGIRVRTIAEGLSRNGRLVRVMPNTPCLVGQSASGYCLGPGTTPADAELVERLLGSVGRAFAVEEKLLDAVTGLSGSGPAFVYIMIEALSDGGVRMGLPRATATALAAQTVKGAAEMVLSTGDHPAVLKDRVASPGGTTIAGLQVLEAGGVRAALIGAVEAAARRSAELGA